MNTTDCAAEVDADLCLIAELCEGEVSRRTEGWRHLIHMQRLRFLVNGAQHTMDALLCLNHNNATYPTKLYLAEKVGTGLNWNETAYMLGREWHTFSWSGVSPQLPPAEVLAAHLAPLNKK